MVIFGHFSVKTAIHENEKALFLEKRGLCAKPIQFTLLISANKGNENDEKSFWYTKK